MTYLLANLQKHRGPLLGGRVDAYSPCIRETHGLCDERGDVASASLLENWIDEARRRAWFLFEASRPAE